MNATDFGSLLAALLHLLPSENHAAISNQFVADLSTAEDRQLDGTPRWMLSRRTHRFGKLNDAQLKTLSALVSGEQRFANLVNPILIPRVSGTPGNLQVQQHITSTLRNLGYTIELDSFLDQPPAPHAQRTFTNIIATLNPQAPRRLVLACHYDSKWDPTGTFVGATDSAVPCAMMLLLASVLNGRLNNNNEVTLQLLFFDGEEAFGEWTATDSLYGSRHLASQLAAQRNVFAADSPGLTQLSSIDVLVLLDLIGTFDTNFVNFNQDTSTFYNRLASTEDRLVSMSLLRRTGRRSPYFGRQVMPSGSFVDDDHRPFQKKGVPIVHLISMPFPSVWHQLSDNAASLHMPTITELNKILAVTVCEYLSCTV